MFRGIEWGVWWICEVGVQKPQSPQEVFIIIQIFVLRDSEEGKVL